MLEYLYLNRAAVFNQDSCLKLKLAPLSTERVQRTMAFGLGREFYKVRKITRAHVGFYSNVKLRVIDCDEKVVYGDASEDHVFHSDSYQNYLATFEHEASVFG